MTIIISKKGANAQKLDKSDFEKEGYLQDYIHNNPESIPIYEIQKDKKLFVVKKEFPTKSGSEKIDALAIDKDGDLYVIETKLYKNPDKRTVVAQALDYGASLWKHYTDFDEFVNILSNEVHEKFNQTLEAKVMEFFELQDEQIQSVFDSMKMNIREGNFKFVILMDSMDEKLKNMITYINQNSQFDIYAVEMEYYKHEQYEIMIPKIFGRLIKKNIETSTGGSRKVWTKEKFLEDAKIRISDEAIYRILVDLFDFSDKSADLLELGTGLGTGSFTFKFKDPRAKSGLVSIFTVWSKGLIEFRYQNIVNRLGEKYSDLFHSELSKIMNIKYDTKSIRLIEAFPNADVLKQFKSTILKFIESVKQEAN